MNYTKKDLREIEAGASLLPTAVANQIVGLIVEIGDLRAELRVARKTMEQCLCEAPDRHSLLKDRDRLKAAQEHYGE